MKIFKELRSMQHKEHTMRYALCQLPSDQEVYRFLLHHNKAILSEDIYQIIK